MPVFETSQESFLGHLEALGVRNGARVCVHSRLVSFGRLPAGAEGVLDALRDMVGPAGTVAVPTFTLNIREDDVFDPATTPPDRVGALSNRLWQMPGAARSRCPVHSYAAIGRDAALLRDADPCRSFGDGSAFDLMQREGFLLVLLGCTFTEGATFAHHVEAEVGVPYREWVDLPRKLRCESGRVRDIRVRYYARKRDLDGMNDLSRIEAAAVARNTGTVVPVPGGARRSMLLDLDRLADTVRDVIRQEPYAMFRLSEEA